MYNILKQQKLNNVEAHFLHAILKLTVSQLALVQNEYESKHSSIKLEPLPKKIDHRFSPEVFKNDGLFYRKTGETYAKAVERLLFDKLLQDKLYAQHILGITASEVQLDCTFESIANGVENELELKKNEKEFITQYVQNKLTLKRTEIDIKENDIKSAEIVAVNQQFDVRMICLYFTFLQLTVNFLLFFTL